MYLARYVYNNFFASSASPKERYAKEYQSIMDKIEAFANDEDAGDNNRHVEESYMPDAVFFRYTGKNSFANNLCDTVILIYSNYSHFRKSNTFVFRWKRSH